MNPRIRLSGVGHIPYECCDVRGRGYGRTAREAYKNWLDSAFVCGRMTYAEARALCAKLDAKRRDKAST